MGLFFLLARFSFISNWYLLVKNWNLPLPFLDVMVKGKSFFTRTFCKFADCFHIFPFLRLNNHITSQFPSMLLKHWSHFSPSKTGYSKAAQYCSCVEKGDVLVSSEDSWCTPGHSRALQQLHAGCLKLFIAEKAPSANSFHTTNQFFTPACT